MGIEQFGAAWGELVRELDWERLGRAYCEGDGSTFFDDEKVEGVLETGLELVDDLVASLPRGGMGRSLYVGAAVAELPLVLAESLALGREVVWLNLPGEEVDELRRALHAVGARLGLDLPLPRTDALATIADESCEHLWMTSVLTDPDAFPALHDALYERVGTELATGRGNLAEDRARADALVRELLRKAAPPAILTTTDEELEIVRPLLAEAGLDIRVPRSETTSAIVGDLVRLARLARVSSPA